MIRRVAFMMLTVLVAVLTWAPLVMAKPD